MCRDVLVVLMIACGCLLRVVWPADMEWKTDEKLVHGMACDMASRGALPEVGIKSGGGIVNPGLSVGLFAAIALLTDDPVGMTRAVQWINVFALMGFLVLGLQKLKGPERDAWRWGLALAAVSPLAILFSRKLWAQDLLPAIAFLIMLGQLNRHKGWGAVLWGMAGALIGQVHMSGFFLAFGLFVFTVLHDRANGLRFHWLPWLAGSALGGIALLPWLKWLWMSPQDTTTNFWHFFQLNFYFHWLIDALGLNVTYSLRDEFWTFLREPVIGGVPTYLVAIAHVVCLVAAGFTVRALVSLARRTIQRFRNTGSWRAHFIGMPATVLYLWSILFGLGLCMPLTGVMIFQHYLICAFPFTYVFLARMLRPHPRLFDTLLIAQLLISVSFLWYIHRNGGAPDGDYGITYRTQTEEQRSLR